MKKKHFLFLVLFCLFLLLMTSCGIPPRCKIPACHVVIDHNHSYGSLEKAGAKTSVSKVYRGLPWYRYLFRKKYSAGDAGETKVKGKYRKIDTREAYDKK